MSKSSRPPLTQEEKDEELIQDLSTKIDEIIELLLTHKDIHMSEQELIDKKKQKIESHGDQELTWHKPTSGKGQVAISKHSKSNLELADSWKSHQKFLDHAMDLQRSLDLFSEQLVNVLERYSSRKYGHKLRNFQMATSE